MHNVNDLIAELQSGKSAEQIAAEMNEELALALAELDRKETQNQTARKRETARRFCLALREYVTSYHPDAFITQKYLASNEPSDEELDEIANMIDELVESFESIEILNKLFNSPKTMPTTAAATLDRADPIDYFLNMFVRK